MGITEIRTRQKCQLQGVRPVGDRLARQNQMVSSRLTEALYHFTYSHHLLETIHQLL